LTKKGRNHGNRAKDIHRARAFVVWVELKSYLQDDLQLTIEEFNRVSTAGIATANRLEQMLDDAAFAFLILTAEDEATDGKLHPRENVVHEAGLFQGKLGFKKAILLLEETCEKFSNIDGLGYIAFPKGKIRAAFEDIRKVLNERLITSEDKLGVVSLRAASHGNARVGFSTRTRARQGIPKKKGAEKN